MWLRDSLALGSHAALPPPSLAVGNDEFMPSFSHVLFSQVSVVTCSSSGNVRQSIRTSTATCLAQLTA